MHPEGVEGGGDTGWGTPVPPPRVLGARKGFVVHAALVQLREVFTPKPRPGAGGEEVALAAAVDEAGDWLTGGLRDSDLFVVRATRRAKR